VNPMQLVLHLGTWGQSHRWHLFWAMGVLFLLAVIAGGAGRRRRGEATTHGSARWARPREVRKAGLYGRHGVVLGRLHGRILLDDSERHVLLCGPTRSGKGISTIIPTLLTWHESTLGA
jgi:type IV secretion system protein VirD4